MITSEYQVTGMSCAHCEAAVREEVGKLPGVTSIDVAASDGHLRIESAAELSDAEVLAAVDEAGYEAVRSR
jgi:copper chaperone CopZ